MELSDVSAFVTHWHEAAAEGVEPEIQAEILQLGDRLMTTIREKPALRSLATSPLLCALLCALHRDRKTELPSDRLRLYEIALEMLIESRDRERQVLPDFGPDLTLWQKHLLLQEFAFWLMMNGRSDASYEEMDSCLDQRLPAMGSHPASSQQVRQYLVERSGLLRSPVEGRVDFIHRTFQEYLAAQEIVYKNSSRFLVTQSHLDQWREVVILAAGLARAGERETFLRAIVARGDEEEEYRHRLHLLAIACLETVRELSPELRANLSVLVGTLQPPTNMSEARAMASAGDLAIPLLIRRGRLTAVVAAACVRALSLIGTPDALSGLKTFGSDRRLTVVRELIRAWEHFDSDTFALEVLGESPLEQGGLRLRSTQLSSGIRFLQNLRRLSVVETGRHPNLDHVTALADLITEFDSTYSQIRDWSGLAAMCNLMSLRIHSGRGSFDCDALATLPLNSLTLVGCHELKNVDGLTDLPLSTLTILGSTELSDVSAVGSLSRCRYLDLDRSSVHDLTFLAGLESLGHLDLARTPIADLAPLGAKIALTWLALNQCEGVEDISPLSNLVNLTGLYLGGCTGIADFTPIGELVEIRALNVSSSHFNDLSLLSSMQSLNQLILSGTQVKSLLPLADHAHLRELRIGSLPVDDLSPLFPMRGLRLLDVAGSRVSDWTQLLEIPSRHYLVDSTCPVDVVAQLRERGSAVSVPRRTQARAGVSSWRQGHRDCYGG